MARADESPAEWLLEARLGSKRLAELLAEELGATTSPAVRVKQAKRKLFVRSSDVRAIEAARQALASLLSRHRVEAPLVVGHWDDELGCWRQTFPPPAPPIRRAAEVVERNLAAVETRTLSVSTGRLVRERIERAMREAATQLGVRCEVGVRKHLFTTQLAFTVTGPAKRIRGFEDELAAECRRTRTEHSDAIWTGVGGF